MTETLSANLVTKQAALLLLQDRMRTAKDEAGYYRTATVFVDAVPIPETAPDAYRIAETALRKLLIEKALFAEQQLEILTEAFDAVYALDD